MASLCHFVKNLLAGDASGNARVWRAFAFGKDRLLSQQDENVIAISPCRFSPTIL